MLVLLGFDRYTAWHDAGQPIRSDPSARHFGHADRHPDATKTVGYPCHSGGDHLGVGVSVTTHLVLTTVHLTAQRCALQQDVFEAKAETFLGHILWRR
jgi:hypothetical protein